MEYEYLCLLDPGCAGINHSQNCIDKNAKREEILFDKERKMRNILMENDLNE